jgi:putative inorganic carbon (HCO3(-)) transporter
MGLCAAMRCFIFKERLNFRGNPLTVPLLAYGAASLLSTVTSISPQLSVHGDMFREEGVFTILSYIALTFSFALFVESEKQIDQLLKGLLVCSAIVSLYAMVQYFGYNPTEHVLTFMRHREGRVGSTLGNPNFLGKFLVITLPLFTAYFIKSVRWVEKTVLLAGAVLSLAALIVTFTRASWLGFSVSILLFFLLLGKKLLINKKKEIVTVLAVLTVVIVVFEVQSSKKKSQSLGNSVATVTTKIRASFDLEKGGGVATRIFAWEKALILIKEKPLLGFGLDTHILVMKRFNLEYLRTFKDFVAIDRVHNNYLDIAIAQGLIGLAAYLSIIITYFLWLLGRMKAEKNPPQKIIYYGIFSALCGYLVNDFFIFSVVSVSPTFWSLMGLTVAMKRVAGDESINKSA